MNKSTARAAYEDYIRANGSYTEDEIEGLLADFDSEEERFDRSQRNSTIASLVVAAVISALAGFGFYTLWVS